MGQEYISYIQTENLFKMWPTIQGIKESLSIELKSLRLETNQDETNDYIYTQIIGNKVLTDIPPSIGKTSDTTGNTALSYKKIMKRDYIETLNRIKEEKLYIELVDDKLNIAFKRLSPTQQKILKLFYIENKTWSEVLEQLKEDDYMSKRQAQLRRQEAIEMIQSISKITVDMYEYVMNLVEVE